ncbi:MAG: hypothetical protein WCF90_10890 [Methanomicrobiales archaeon]
MLPSNGAAATIIALTGDLVGESSPQSGLLSDEPSLLFFNEFANSSCTRVNPEADSGDNMVATPCNHESDRGTEELLREVNGRNGNVSIIHLADPDLGAARPPHSADDLRFLNETESVNSYVAEVRKYGLHAIVVLLHEVGKTGSLRGLDS